MTGNTPGAVVMGVTESPAIGHRACRSSHQRFGPVTNTARRNVAAVYLCLRLVATETRIVRARSARNRQGDAAIERPMATTALGSCVQRMIEPAAEAPQRWKCLHSFQVVRMTDRADRT